LIAPGAVAAAQTAFYVATTGGDTNPGTKAKPFATLERARDAIRALKKAGGLPKGGVTVWIRGGLYPRAESFALNADDSGTKQSPIVYRAYGKEQVRLSGGREVTGFAPVADPAILARLDEAARGKVRQTDLRAQGITDLGEIRPRGFGKPAQPEFELFFDGRPMTLARWPDGEWAKIAAVPAGNDSGKFSYDGDRPKRWQRTDDIWVHGYWTYDWAESHVKVKSIDTEAREIVTEEPYGVYGYTADRRFYFLNILEELDAPGEWYLDRQSGVLYFWPPSPIDKVAHSSRCSRSRW